MGVSDLNDFSGRALWLFLATFGVSPPYDHLNAEYFATEFWSKTMRRGVELQFGFCYNRICQLQQKTKMTINDRRSPLGGRSPLGAPQWLPQSAQTVLLTASHTLTASQYHIHKKCVHVRKIIFLPPVIKQGDLIIFLN